MKSARAVGRAALITPPQPPPLRGEGEQEGFWLPLSLQGRGLGGGVSFLPSRSVREALTRRRGLVMMGESGGSAMPPKVHAPRRAGVPAAVPVPERTRNHAARVAQFSQSPPRRVVPGVVPSAARPFIGRVPRAGPRAFGP